MTYCCHCLFVHSDSIPISTATDLPGHYSEAIMSDALSDQLGLKLLHSSVNDVKKKRGGPPNRMNDLSYSDWMKFQKSFFRYTSDQALIEECIHFFTKERWESGSHSQSLIVGFDQFQNSIGGAREVIARSTPHALGSMPLPYMQTSDQYDFALFDFRSLINDRRTLFAFLSEQADNFFRSLRSCMVEGRYCGVVVGMEEGGGGGFPLPWLVAAAARPYLKLRDEKVGLLTEDGRVLYILFFQAVDDGRRCKSLGSISTAQHSESIPAWTIPRPPPRKFGEILHPAKYPETLVAEFVELFSKPGDRVIDPMVGTGSTVVAAVQKNRHGYGIDLNEEFVSIAQRRASVANSPSLFGEVNETIIVRGDASKIDQIDKLNGLEFDYAITSPPYWSMLSNTGSENQKARRDKDLQLTYSESEKDVGNVEDYDQFLSALSNVYHQLAQRLSGGKVLTVVVKNVKREHILYTLAWDLTAELCGSEGDYDYLGTTLWCQDNVGLKPFAVGTHWVSNILHQYCLHFRRRDKV